MNDRILRLPSVIEKTGKPRSSIYWMVENDLFPKPLKLSVRSVGWLESEINQWISDRINLNK